MKRIRRYVNRLSVQRKLVAYGYLTFIPVMTVVFIVLTITNYNKQSDAKYQSNMSEVNALADSIQTMQNNVKDISTYLCINSEIYSLLTADNPGKENRNAKLWLEEAPMQIVEDMLAVKGNIKTIAIYPENGIRPFLRCMDFSAYVPEISLVRETSAYRNVLECENGMLWTAIPKGRVDVFQNSRTDKVVLCREIYDMTQKKRLGFIVLGLNQTDFEDMSKSILKDELESVVILDPNGGLLSKVGNINPKVEEYLLSESFIGQEYRNRESCYFFEDYVIISKQINRNSSIVCKIIPKYSWKTQFWNFVYMPITVTVSVLAALLPLLWIISKTFTKPLRKLSVAIRKFSEGDFEQQVEVTSHDEIGEVAECFNQMVRDIKRLIDENYVITLQEKESELALLQAQINPHFLYNTLNSLYWKAVEKGDDEIGESILSLSQLFRLVLNQGRKEVTVSQEIELIANYLKIQKLRFTKRLNYEIKVDKSVEKTLIPKLILQPFIENAIVHGLENINRTFHLTVKVYEKDQHIHLEVSDTGVGMTKEQMDSIWEDEPENYAKQRIGGYAIKNIRERLKMQYGEDFTLEIKSKVGEGTGVFLIIPFER